MYAIAPTVDLAVSKLQSDFIAMQESLVSCPDLRDPFYVSILVWSGRELGWAFYVFLFLCVWPGVVLNQRQLSIVVSD